MARGRPLDVERELLEEFERNGRVTEYLVSVLPDAIWRLPPPAGRGRTIAAMVAHIHGVRRTFAKLGGAGCSAAARSSDGDKVTGAACAAAIDRRPSDALRGRSLGASGARQRDAAAYRQHAAVPDPARRPPSWPDLHARQEPRARVPRRRRDARVGLESAAGRQQRSRR